VTTTLLQTKLYIPTLRPNAVPRTKLIAKLNRGFEKGRQITLVSAPAGFGKTTTIAAWIYDLRFTTYDSEQVTPNKNLKSAWLSLDAEDNDPAQFLAYFVAALQTIDEAIGSGIPTNIYSPGEVDWQSLLVGVLNGVTAVSDTHDPIFLILDDIHTRHHCVECVRTFFDHTHGLCSRFKPVCRRNDHRLEALQQRPCRCSVRVQRACNGRTHACH